MTERTIYSGTQWEKDVAYSRAKRVGNLIFVAGTTAVDGSQSVVAPGDPYGQTKFIFQKIEAALLECGASLADVVRTRMFVTDIDQFQDVARAHRDTFEGIDPVATCVQVGRLVSPELLIEIEVDAVLRQS